MLSLLERDQKINSDKSHSADTTGQVPIVKSRKVSVRQLVYYEACIALLEEIVEHHSVLLKQRKGTHFSPVEKKIQELNLRFIEYYSDELEMLKKNCGSRPFEEYMHERIAKEISAVKNL